MSNILAVRQGSLMNRALMFAVHKMVAVATFFTLPHRNVVVSLRDAQFEQVRRGNIARINDQHVRMLSAAVRTRRDSDEDKVLMERAASVRQFRALLKEEEDQRVAQIEKVLNKVMKENPFSEFQGDKDAYIAFCWPFTGEENEARYQRAFRSSWNLHMMRAKALAKK